MYWILSYLIELNVSLIILYVAYRLFFGRDKNFRVRRIYLIGNIALPFLIPLFPDAMRLTVQNIAPLSFDLPELTISASGNTISGTPGMALAKELVFMIYMAILAVGVIRLLIQFLIIWRTISRSERMNLGDRRLLAAPSLHASSFFGYIFMDPVSATDDSFRHILAHERIPRRQWHSLDRLLAEFLVIINWFNPVAWMVRRSMVQNLEYLADSTVIGMGANLSGYQLTILNQYIGNASLYNQFSSHIKQRIDMLNKNYKSGRWWKLFLLLPLAVIVFYLFSCSERGDMFSDEIISKKPEQISPDELPSFKKQDPLARDEIFYIVEEMPKFDGGDPAKEFRKYIAQNLRYPIEAASNGVTGRIFISFIVTSNGKVVIPNAEDLASISDKAMDEVVVVAYRTIEEGTKEPDKKFQEMLRKEVIRVVSSSPDWTPGKQRGVAVNVLYTFPVNFVLQ